MHGLFLCKTPFSGGGAPPLQEFIYVRLATNGRPYEENLPTIFHRNHRVVEIADPYKEIKKTPPDRKFCPGYFLE